MLSVLFFFLLFLCLSQSTKTNLIFDSSLIFLLCKQTVIYYTHLNVVKKFLENLFIFQEIFIKIFIQIRDKENLLKIFRCNFLN